MLLSLIVPAFKVENFIGDCLGSCINQSNNKDFCYEIVVVDDGSPDKSYQIAKNELKNFNPHQIIQQENKGLSAARNIGLSHTKGDYVWFIDSDDWISSDSLSIISKKLQDDNPDILMIRAANCFDNKQVIRQRKFPYVHSNVSGEDIFLSDCWTTCVPFFIIRRDFLIKNNLKFMEGVFHEDNEFTPRLLLAAKKVSQINDVLYFVRQNPNSITRSVNPKKAFDIIKVLNSLDLFINNNNFPPYILAKFGWFISMTLNVALIQSQSFEKNVKQEFTELIQKNKHLIRYYKLSKIPRYFTEWLLFRFSDNIVKSFGLLNKLTKRR